jgi:hypothetical protein
MYNSHRSQSSHLLEARSTKVITGRGNGGAESRQGSLQAAQFPADLILFFGGNFLIQQDASNLKHLPSGDFFLKLKG